MDRIINERINAINNHILPPGYYRTKDIGIAPSDWMLGKLSDAVTPVKRVKPKPDQPYWRLGIKSWAKGTFHTYVDEPDTVDMDELYEVHENDLVVNITFAWEHAIAIAKKEDHGLLVSHRFPTYEFKANQCPGYYKVLIAQPFFKDLLDHISPGGAGRNRVLNQKDFLDLPCYIPPFEEQKRIAAILEQYDELISLLEKKTETYKILKKICLSKMYPQQGKTIPELRFPKFTEDWEQRKLGEAFVSLQNNTLSRADLTADTGAAKNVHYGDVLIKFGEFLDASSSDLPYIPSRQIVDKFKASLLQDGDVIMADTAEDEAVGKCTEIAGLQGFPTISGLHTIPLRPKEKFAPGYLGYYMNSCSYHDQLLPLMQGIKVTSVSKGAILNTDISYPADSNEQAKIGGFFIQLDNLITLHQRKCNEELQRKKAVMQLLMKGIVRVKK